MSAAIDVSAARLRTVDNTQRGLDIQRRRRHLGIRTVAEFERETKRGGAKGLSYDAISAAEKGEAREDSYAFLEQWLDEREEGDGFEPGEVLSAAKGAPPLEFIEFTVKAGGDFEITMKAPPGSLEEAREFVTRLMADREERGSD